MDDWLNIRNTGVTVLELLDLMHEGYSREDIVRKRPTLTDDDISGALRTVLGLVICLAATMSNGRSHEFMRAGPPVLSDDMPWTNAEDDELHRLKSYSVNIDTIARLLRRSKKAVLNRLAGG